MDNTLTADESDQLLAEKQTELEQILKTIEQKVSEQKEINQNVMGTVGAVPEILEQQKSELEVLKGELTELRRRRRTLEDEINSLGEGSDVEAQGEDSTSFDNRELTGTDFPLKGKKDLKEFFQNKLTALKSVQGALTMVAVAAVVIKIFGFYGFMGVSSNFILVSLFTCVIVALLFASFRNKWIPAVIFVLISVLMFADVAYSSFFNRYLSIGMIGAAGFLGDVMASVREVVKPRFFLLFADLIFVFAALIYRKVQKHNSGAGGIETSDGLQVPQSKKKSFFLKLLQNHWQPAAMILLILIFVSNWSGSYLITSIANQELFSYHTKDLLTTVGGDQAVHAVSEDVSIVTGVYESEKDGALFGVAKDRNLIVIQAESLQNFVIGASYEGQELTPNLNRLIGENTIYFNNYFQQVAGGNTSDAEFATNNSIYGSLQSYTYRLYQDNYFRGLPVLLKEKGYQTEVLHAYKKDFWNRASAYPNLGFDSFKSEEAFDEGESFGMGLSDEEFFNQSIQYMKELDQPFYSFLITLSNHYPFQLPYDLQEIRLLLEDDQTTFGNYLNSVHYMDQAIGDFIEQLKEEGLYEHSVIAIYGDHAGLTKSDEEISASMGKYLGKEYDYDTMLNIPLIIHMADTQEPIHQTVETTSGQMDFMPTMAYLMGFDTLDTIYLGHNILTRELEDGFVAEQNFMEKGSYFKGDIAFEMSKDGVFEHARAWNRKTGKRVSLDQCWEDYVAASLLIDNSKYYLDNDILRRVYVDRESAVELVSRPQTLDPPTAFAEAGAPDALLAGTNSREALDASYDSGYRFIKVNVSWTTDGRTVLLKDWDNLEEVFVNSRGPCSYDEFSSMKMRNGLTQMTISDLVDWMRLHPDVHVAVDLKQDMLYLLDAVVKNYEDIVNQIIPVVSVMDEYSWVEFNAYPNVMFQVEDGAYTQRELTTFLSKNNRIWAVALPAETAEKEYSKLYHAQDTAVYIYDVDDLKQAQELFEAGIEGVFTNLLLPEELSVPVSSGGVAAAGLAVSESGLTQH